MENGNGISVKELGSLLAFAGITPICWIASRWILAKQNNLLPVKYHHTVFTVPAELQTLFKYNKKLLYNLLFKCAWETTNGSHRQQKATIFLIRKHWPWHWNGFLSSRNKTNMLKKLHRHFELPEYQKPNNEKTTQQRFCLMALLCQK